MTRFLLPFLLLSTACKETPADEAGPPTAAERAATLGTQGPYAVGYARGSVTYRPIGSDEDRTLPVEIWYPGVANRQAPPASYSIEGIVDVAAPHAQTDLTVADDGPFPVAVYSHGSGGIGMLAYPYAERFASHGWIVAAPDHVGNTSLDLLRQDEDATSRIMLDRPQDISAVLDQAEAGLTPALTGAADTSHSFLFGHSFGGYTTFVTGGVGVDACVFDDGCTADSTDEDCELFVDPEIASAFATGLGDPRLLAVAPQAPALIAGFVAGSLAGLDKPVMLMSSARDQTTPDPEEAVPAWAQLDNPDDVWVHVPQGGHYSFISICDDLGVDVVSAFQPDAIDDGCGPDFTPTLELIPAFTTYMLAFARMHVLGEAEWAPVLDVELNAGNDINRHE